MLSLAFSCTRLLMRGPVVEQATDLMAAFVYGLL
jgi:hypothetical protein